MKTTFSDLGIPFPLYEAPVSPSDDSDYTGKGICSVCGITDAHCFRLGIPTDLIIRCSSCGTENGVNINDAAAVQCRACEAIIPYPPNVAAKGEPQTCYDCLRAGKVAIAKDTEFGWSRGMR